MSKRKHPLLAAVHPPPPCASCYNPPATLHVLEPTTSKGFPTKTNSEPIVDPVPSISLSKVDVQKKAPPFGCCPPPPPCARTVLSRRDDRALECRVTRMWCPCACGPLSRPWRRAIDLPAPSGRPEAARLSNWCRGPPFPRGPSNVPLFRGMAWGAHTASRPLRPSHTSFCPFVCWWRAGGGAGPWRPLAAGLTSWCHGPPRVALRTVKEEHRAPLEATGSRQSFARAIVQ